ncbi:DUF2141 domain-containing protein [Sphingomonas jatrophae]|uniref:Uncharacterized conserved protein, DUF2141 family n=1 Tax=Sphingomonas jatrophae TaxID=1166337 RepID=A0A1I6LC41_9SPHN|nr:DUF2141 domain-containing protein [Sphingomonas jatrophae]SFS00828.1 Uncharacterized conserved protein, DUF2141 family [Sphingomonas jatrophae]
MLKRCGWTMAAAGLVALGMPAAAAVLGPEAPACRAEANVPAVLVRVDGFKARTGGLRVQIYGSNPDDFLEKGRKLKRIDLPVTPRGAMEVCVALPKAGNYAVAVRHDIDGSGKSGWNDGGGFSRNPKLSLFSYKPKYEEVVVGVGAGTRTVDVRLNYRQGLSIGPVRREG